MKKLAHTLLAAGSLFAAVATTHAQTAPRIAVVDVEKIFNQHYETAAENAKMDGEKKSAQKSLDGIVKQIQDLAEQAKALQEQGNNPTMTPDAKKKAGDDFQAKVQELNQKRQEAVTFRNNALNEMQQQFNQFRTQLADKIIKLAQRIAKERGDTILINSGAVLYADSSYDITDAVIAEINKNKPADAASAAPSASSDTGASSTSPSSAPTFSVPNVTPSK